MDSPPHVVTSPITTLGVVELDEASSGTRSGLLSQPALESLSPEPVPARIRRGAGMTKQRHATPPICHSRAGGNDNQNHADPPMSPPPDRSLRRQAAAGIRSRGCSESSRQVSISAFRGYRRLTGMRRSRRSSSGAPRYTVTQTFGNSALKRLKAGASPQVERVIFRGKARSITDASASVRPGRRCHSCPAVRPSPISTTWEIDSTDRFPTLRNCSAISGGR